MLFCVGLFRLNVIVCGVLVVLVVGVNFIMVVLLWFSMCVVVVLKIWFFVCVYVLKLLC